MLVTINMMLWTPASGTPPQRQRPSRQNFYNYRTDYDDDLNYSQFEGDTNGNYHSEFGLRTTSRPTGRLTPTPQPHQSYADEDPDPSDSWADDIEQQQLESPVVRVKEVGRGAWLDGIRGSTHTHQAGDGSYSFGYDLHDQSRHETSDSFGNVYGYYSYIDDDGILRRVSYSAGPSTGFVVHNSQKSRVRPPIIVPPIKSPPLLIPESPKYHQGWDQDEQEPEYHPQRQPPRPWPPRRRKPTYVVKIRRPVKKEPGTF